MSVIQTSMKENVKNLKIILLIVKQSWRYMLIWKYNLYLERSPCLDQV